MPGATLKKIRSLLRLVGLLRADEAEPWPCHRYVMEVDQLLHILPEPALMLSLPNGVVLAVNGQFEQAFGFVITSCAGKSLAELGFCERAEQRALLTKLTTRAASGPFDLKCF